MYQNGHLRWPGYCYVYDRKSLTRQKIGMFSFLELDKIAPEYRNQQSFFKNMANTYEFIIKTFQLLKATQSPQDNKDILKIIPSLNSSQS